MSILDTVKVQRKMGIFSLGEVISMKKTKNPMAKFRSAIRLIWSRSAERKMHIKLVTRSATDVMPYPHFICPVCDVPYPIQMADVDHEPPLGSLNSIDELSDFTKRMFNGPQRAICKMCHKKKTASQRKKGAK